MLKRWGIGVGLASMGLIVAAIYWLANPSQADLELLKPLETQRDPLNQSRRTHHGVDYLTLASGFKPQKFRSFCGPASIATVLRAYGKAEVDQRYLFPSIGFKAKVFFSGITLAELATLAERNGLQTTTVYADTLTLDDFRDRLVSNMATLGDYVLINYHRRVLKQKGGGHISPIAAYDAKKDAFLVLDQATFKYPFTWVPTQLLYDAANTRDGATSRGILLITGYASTH